MDFRIFSHSFPYFLLRLKIEMPIKEIGSTEPAGMKTSARELSLLLDASRARLDAAYSGAPRIKSMYDKAKRRLEELIARQ